MISSLHLAGARVRHALLAVGLGVVLASPVAAADGLEAAATLDGAIPSPFGIGSSAANGRDVRGFGRWLPRMQDIGVNNLRSVAANWGRLETAPGQWEWAGFDAQMEYAARQGMAVGVLLNGNPAWNTLDDRRSLPVNNLHGWSQYVTQVAQRVKGRARLLEVWNEPPNGTGPEQTAADYARLVIAASRAARAVDPSFRIGLAAKSAHVHYLEAAIRAGAREHFDYITLHPYEVLDSALRNPRSERIYLHIVPTVRRMLANAAPEKRNVPIVFTELGVDTRRHGEDGQADALVKAYALGIAQGVANIQWFEGMDGDTGPLGLLDARGQPRAAYHAMGVLIEHLGHRPRFVGRAPLAEGAVAYVFTGAAGPVAVAWGDSDQDIANVPLGGTARVLPIGARNPMRVERLRLARSPVLVLDVPAAWQALAETYPRGTALPGESFAAAEEVSMTFSPVPRSRGLHTLLADDVIRSIIDYGGNVRAGELPGGDIFVVDPSFLSYDTEPIEITVVARRHADAPPDRPVRMRLRYEASTRSGFEAPGSQWFVLRPGTEWQTRTWRVNDASFVNYWGYGFALMTDCKGCDAYELQRVTVRKLRR